jgi:hypothetical protein
VKASLRQGGYVMLALLVALAIAAAAASTLFGLVWAADSNAAADSALQRATAAARQSMTALADDLVWGGMSGLWHGATGATDEASRDGASVDGSALRVADAEDPDRFDLVVTAHLGAARAQIRRVVTLRAAGIPVGLSVAGDLTLRAALVLDGCGAYVAGDVLGREHVTVSADVAGSAPDRARPEQWSRAAVHAGGRIYDENGEVHSAAGASMGDTDACTGDNAVATPLWPLGDAGLVVLRAHGGERWCAPPADRLSLTEVTLGLPVATAPQTGCVVVLHARGSALRLEGWRDLSDLAPQATVVVLGDAVLTSPEGSGEPEGVGLSGSLLVTGTLTVDAPTVVIGGMAAGRLIVRAPTTVLVPDDWSRTPPPGAWIAFPVPVSEEAT